MRRLISEYKNNSVQKADWSFKGDLQEMLICLFFLKPVSRLFIYLFIFSSVFEGMKTNLCVLSLSYYSFRYNEHEACCIFVFTSLKGRCRQGLPEIERKILWRGKDYFFLFHHLKKCLIWPDRFIWNLPPLFTFIFCFKILFTNFFHRKIFINVPLKCYYPRSFSGERSLMGCLAQVQYESVQIPPAIWALFNTGKKLHLDSRYFSVELNCFSRKVEIFYLIIG